jgi:hypothetical protein
MERLTKTTKNLSQGSRSPGPDLNPRPLEYEVGVLETQPRPYVIYRLVKDAFHCHKVIKRVTMATAASNSYIYLRNTYFVT